MYFPTAVQIFDNPLSSADSTWGLVFTGFNGTIRLLRLPEILLAAFRFLHLAIPCLNTIVLDVTDSYSIGHLELFTRFPNGIPKEMSGSLWIPASSQCSFALFPRHRLDHPSRPFRTSDIAPDEHNYRDSNVQHFDVQ